MGRLRMLAVCVVVAVGGLATIASGDTTTKGGTGSKSNPAAADVTVTKCALAANTLEGPSATLTVTNNSSKASNYIITVAYESPDGKTQLDTGNATVQNLAPGQTATTDAPSLKSELRSQQFTCKVADVTRLSAAG